MSSRCRLLLYFEEFMNGNGRMTDLHLENFHRHNIDADHQGRSLHWQVEAECFLQKDLGS